MEAGQDEALRETLDRLRREIAELRASRERLVLAGDAEHRAIERDLHGRVQQRLVALAVNLQLARQSVENEPTAATARLEDLERDVQQALDETAQLAQRIYPQLLEVDSLVVALRSAAGSAGVPAAIDVRVVGSYPPEVVRTIYLCCLGALERAGAGGRVVVSVRDDEESLVFEVVGDGTAVGPGFETELGRLRDRVEALGGRLTMRSEPDGETCVSGSLPRSR